MLYLFLVSLHCGPVVDFTTLHPFDFDRNLLFSLLIVVAKVNLSFLLFLPPSRSFAFASVRLGRVRQNRPISSMFHGSLSTLRNMPGHSFFIKASAAVVSASADSPWVGRDLFLLFARNCWRYDFHALSLAGMSLSTAMYLAINSCAISRPLVISISYVTAVTCFALQAS